MVIELLVCKKKAIITIGVVLDLLADFVIEVTAMFLRYSDG